MCTEDQYAEQQRQQALTFAPPAPITEPEFVYRATFYPLPVLRQASMRYSPARGRNHGQVLSRFLEVLRNPNVNRGDDLAAALGHIEATCRRMMEV